MRKSVENPANKKNKRISHWNVIEGSHPEECIEENTIGHRGCQTCTLVLCNKGSPELVTPSGVPQLLDGLA